MTLQNLYKLLSELKTPNKSIKRTIDIYLQKHIVVLILYTSYTEISVTAKALEHFTAVTFQHNNKLNNSDCVPSSTTIITSGNALEVLQEEFDNYIKQICDHAMSKASNYKTVRSILHKR